MHPLISLKALHPSFGDTNRLQRLKDILPPGKRHEIEIFSGGGHAHDRNVAQTPI